MRDRSSPGTSVASCLRLRKIGAAGIAMLFLLVISGCATSKPGLSKEDAELQRTAARSAQLYLLASPHSRLHVEVDAVEGYSPSEEMLNKLKAFLGTYCDKPGGIEIARSDVIPRKEAIGILPSSLARKYLNGPPAKKGEAIPAYLYVLCYSDVLCDRPRVAETGHVGARTAQRSRLRNRNPHVLVSPYPAMIYMNMEWHPKSVHDEALLHEAGHILGLAFRPIEATKGHCDSHSCLMTPGPGLFSLLLGLEGAFPDRLCGRCLDQLAQNKTNVSARNLSFVGPVLVRSESGYHVLSLPRRTKVILGDLTQRDCREFATEVHDESAVHDGNETDWHGSVSGDQELLADPEQFAQVVRRISADPDPFVPYIVPSLWTACASRFNSLGQYSNAVEACRQAVRTNPEDHRSQNLLAWIKATCPDDSIRDGKQAVSAGTKACELTRWSEWNYIDTLAAAWAEAGDFDRAVRFQELALRIGKPGQDEAKQMGERLSLYKQARPFREKH